MAHLYTYSARITQVLDGDTVRAAVRLGFNISADMTFRLLGIDAPEIRGPEKPEGLRAKQALSDRILNQDVIIKSHKDRPDKYGGRYLAEIFLSEQEGDPSINRWMIESGFAKEYSG